MFQEAKNCGIYRTVHAGEVGTHHAVLDVWNFIYIFQPSYVAKYIMCQWYQKIIRNI